MPRKVSVRLTAAQGAEIERAQHAPVIERRRWPRREMVRPAALSASIPAAASGLGLHPQTVRRHVKAVLAGGVAALADAPRSGRPAKLTEAVLTAPEARLDADAANGARTRTLPQAAAGLAEEQGVAVNAGYLGEVLKRRDFRWKRTGRSSRHRQTDGDRRARKAAASALLPLCRRAPKRA